MPKNHLLKAPGQITKSNHLFLGPWLYFLWTSLTDKQRNRTESILGPWLMKQRYKLKHRWLTWIWQLIPTALWKNTLVGESVSTHYISWHFMHFLPTWYIATNNAHWPCCCHIIANTCHLITYTCCLPNETVVWWQHRLWLRRLSSSSPSCGVSAI